MTIPEATHKRRERADASGLCRIASSSAKARMASPLVISRPACERRGQAGERLRTSLLAWGNIECRWAAAQWGQLPNCEEVSGGRGVM